MQQVILVKKINCRSGTVCRLECVCVCAPPAGISRQELLSHPKCVWSGVRLCVVCVPSVGVSRQNLLAHPSVCGLVCV
jgi:hypothetical protein